MIRENISIYTIAKEAGVSPATVSRVLTNNARVSEEKRRRVKEVIDKYDYKPNAMARALSNTKSKTIGLVTADIRNPYYAAVAIACEQAANEKGYILMVCNTLSNPELEEHHLEKLFEQRVDAIILCGGKADELISDEEYVEKMNQVADIMPVVITGKLDGANCYQVNINQVQAMETLMDYLISNGHEKILFMGGRKEVKSTYEKIMCYKNVLRRNGITNPNEYIWETGKYDYDSGYQQLLQFMDHKVEMPTAIVAINDFTALGIIRALQERGYRVPQDVSVVSFDNTYLAELSNPMLTSIGCNYEELGERLVQTAIDAMDGGMPPRFQLIGTSLCKRESSVQHSNEKL